jgi:hypothetical protein
VSDWQKFQEGFRGARESEPVEPTPLPIRLSHEQNAQYQKVLQRLEGKQKHMADPRVTDAMKDAIYNRLVGQQREEETRKKQHQQTINAYQAERDAQRREIENAKRRMQMINEAEERAKENLAHKSISAPSSHNAWIGRMRLLAPQVVGTPNRAFGKLPPRKEIV